VRLLLVKIDLGENAQILLEWAEKESGRAFNPRIYTWAKLMTTLKSTQIQLKQHKINSKSTQKIHKKDACITNVD
jgi:hypothetical protein